MRVRSVGSQEQFAAAAGVTRNTIVNVEREAFAPRWASTMANLARGLGISLEELHQIWEHEQRGTQQPDLPALPSDPLTAALAATVPNLSGPDLDTVARLALLALAPHQRLALLTRWAKSRDNPATLVELARAGKLLDDDDHRLTAMRVAASTGVPKPPKPPKHKPEGGT